MKRIFATLLFVFSVTLCRGQWVTIPDPNFVSWLQTHYPSCMNGNLMDTTCSLIVNETILSIDTLSNFYDLTGVEFFDSLKVLKCTGDNIQYINSLPAHLSFLDCSENFMLTQLPSLPTTLDTLICFIDGLTSLPDLPSGLLYLECGWNQLTQIPELPSTLNWFDCSINSLTQLPTLPNSLRSISCSDNSITQLPVLPDSLFGLECYNNVLISLPEFPSTLMGLQCYNNLNLTCLPLLPSSLQYLDFTSTGITCIPNYINIVDCYPPLTSLPICDIYNSGGCNIYNNISGQVYFDSNLNCIIDSSETPSINIPIQLWNGGNLIQQAVTWNYGNYSFDVNSFGSYEIKIDTLSFPFTVVCPSGGIQASLITANDSIDIDKNFGLLCISNYDVEVGSSVIDSGAFVPGRKCLASIHAGDMSNFYGMNCINGVGGQLQATVTGTVQYNGYAAGSLAPTTVTGNTITWNIADFGTVDFFHDFHIRLLTDTTATIGDFVCIDATVTANPADVNQSNNHLNQCFTVVSSFDPNEKEVSPQELTTANDWLTYTIHFQNTGTAPAQHIQILDTLDNDLDVSTFQLLAYSHPNMTQVVEGGIVKFNFPNINLPDSTSNEPASHGYIQYKIKPSSGVTPTTTFENTASIYFDFNSPVVTNTTHTSFATGIKQLAVDSWQFAVYPNPVVSQMTVYSEQLAGSTITVTDVFGRIIYSEQTNQKSKILTLKSFSSGVYFIKVQSQQGEMQVKKFVKQ